jgi:hypothetical protein
MKKYFYIVLVLVLPVTGLRAQSLSDDITQLVLDVQKLTQMKQILSDMYQGYAIVSKGYEDIKNLSQGTFSLHKAFLDGLLAVSPAVASYAKVADILNKEANLVKEYQSAKNYFQGTGRFTSQELDYFSGVYNNLFNGSLKNVNELVMVITQNQLRMSDAERFDAIDRIDRDITSQLGFLRSFDNNAAMQAMQRAKAGQDIGTLRVLHGVSP